jgi:pyruvate dehydrogenase E2 component (dihydrolipoamide acetyltransferase)
MAATRIMLRTLRRGVLIAPCASAPANVTSLHMRRFARSLSALPEHKLLTMPRLSPTMEVGTIQEWKVAPGDSIAAGDVIAEIETDKATRSFEYQDDGFMAKVRAHEARLVAIIL